MGGPGSGRRPGGGSNVKIVKPSSAKTKTRDTNKVAGSKPKRAMPKRYPWWEPWRS